MTKLMTWVVRLIFLWLLIGLTPLVRVLPGYGPKPDPAEQVAAAPRSGFNNPFGPDPALWLVEDPDSRIYLFGTVHVLRPELEWMTPKVARALSESGSLWVETRLDDPAQNVQLVLDTYGREPSGSLTSRLTAEEKAQVLAVVHGLGISQSDIEPLRPWLASFLISQVALEQTGYTPAAGVETVLERAASLRNIPVRELESSEQHFRFLADLPPEIEKQMLLETVTSGEATTAGVDRIAARWARGDLKPLDQDMARMKTEAPELYDVLIAERNTNWAAQISSLMAGSGVHFIAVGAGHLSGPDSLQAMLEARGYEVRRK
ncbi:TraB/GumN family protein [Phenylobacterium sp.]|jgi:hypothetical protein|uniref:TraB/GumN family protein n=1 Tax=Phenylobacterium sp. TaxID=1871053 RepID=UPI002E33C436|nr:TraB/GumN family protein [Phenylobacterium sp.]HEX2559964.1 TraB/GumN family protein [Phenylobacterium sp.]